MFLIFLRTILRTILKYIILYFEIEVNYKFNDNNLTIEYLHWKRLYYKSLTLNNINKHIKKRRKSCNF